jgi:outer membrane protein
LEQSKVDLKDKVNQAHNDLKGALAAYKAALKTEAARREAFRYSQNKFEVGLLNSFDFQQAKTRLEMSENDLIQTKYDFFFKAKVLEFYFGIPFGELQI